MPDPLPRRDRSSPAGAPRTIATLLCLRRLARPQKPPPNDPSPDLRPAHDSPEAGTLLGDEPDSYPTIAHVLSSPGISRTPLAAEEQIVDGEPGDEAHRHVER